jgi:endoglucanase
MDMRGVVMTLFSSLCAAAATGAAEIKVDQAGYLPAAPKLAMVAVKSAASAFTVRSAGDGAVVFPGTLSQPVEDPDTGDRVQTADFTGLKKPGRYYLEVPGVGRSWEFAIGPDAFSRVFYLAMRSYYGQRCGTAVDLGAEFPGYSYAACHRAAAYHASSGASGPRASVKGWHDAGDYGRYVVNSGIATGTLLWTWELFGPRVKAIRLNIPERLE